MNALRLLLKGQGYETEGVTSPAELLRAVAASEFDLLMDLNYARDTTRDERAGPAQPFERNRRRSGDCGHDRLGDGGTGGRGHAIRRGRFCEKPRTNARLLEILQKQIALGRAEASRRRVAQENQDHKEIALQFHLQEREVAEARSIQQGLRPGSIPQLAGCEIAGAWQPAQSVGGDYYDVLAFDETTLGLCIADVAGKGLPAALLMSNLQAAVRGLASPSLPPGGLCSRLNSLVCHNTGNDRFITFLRATRRPVAASAVYERGAQCADSIAPRRIA